MLRFRPVVWILWLALPAPCADGPVVPYSVCEILRDLPKFETAPIAALGRYSFREQGRWLSEDACDGPGKPTVLWLTEDGKEGPKAPDQFEIDAVTLNRKFAELRQHTALGKFRFGSSDYDRWAVVYGKVAPRTGDAARKSPAELVFRGDGVVVFLNP
ncbi:MAG TPA: hypothetical protein VKT49_15305 [Bryobacteraceae bacterium]|nr:hypothetical protein [Bryobacteraceae bacterium]